LPKFHPAIKDTVGEYPAGGMNKTMAFAGEQPPNRVVVLKFPSAKAFRQFEDGENEKKLRDDVSKNYADWKAPWFVKGGEQK
jgi:hypothetical protein